MKKEIKTEIQKVRVINTHAFPESNHRARVKAMVQGRGRALALLADIQGPHVTHTNGRTNGSTRSQHETMHASGGSGGWMKQAKAHHS